MEELKRQMHTMRDKLETSQGAQVNTNTNTRTQYSTTHLRNKNLLRPREQNCPLGEMTSSCCCCCDNNWHLELRQQDDATTRSYNGVVKHGSEEKGGE